MKAGIETFLRKPYLPPLPKEETLDLRVTNPIGSAPISLLVFKLQESLFGVSSTAVEIVEHRPTIETVPFVQSRRCSGFIPFRGKAVPLLAVTELLRLKYNKEQKNPRMLVIAHERLSTAIIVDEVLGIYPGHLMAINSSALEPRTLARVAQLDRMVSLIQPQELCNAFMEERQ